MKRFYPVIFALSGMLLFTSCKKDGLNDDASQRPDFAYNIDVTKLLELVNKVRAEGCNCGDEKMYPVPPVTWSEQLAQAAYAHSLDMDTNKFPVLLHKGSDGSNTKERIESKGYDWAAGGENLARGQETEAEVMNSWLTSPKHCVNIMYAGVKEMGAGRSGNYWTQVFASHK